MKSPIFKLVEVLICLFIIQFKAAQALTANQVSFEFRPNGIYRVYVYYTVPALKEFRESYIEFTQRPKAEKFYFDLLRGADFYLDDPERVEFINKPLEPSPW